MFYKTRAARFLNCFEGMSLGSPNKGLNCERKILAYKKNKPGLITILYMENLMLDVLIDCQAHALLMSL